MRTLRSLIIGLALASAAGAAPAHATPNGALPVTVAFSPQFEAKLRSEYGIKEADVLRAAITEAIGSAVVADGAKRISIEVMLESAKPTHPTMEQLSREPSLDFLRSVSPGGADLSATLRGEDGRALGHVTFSYYAPTLQLASRAGEAWADARLSIQRFAAAIAKKIKSIG